MLFCEKLLKTNENSTMFIDLVAPSLCNFISNKLD